MHLKGGSRGKQLSELQNKIGYTEGKPFNLLTFTGLKLSIWICMESYADRVLAKSNVLEI